jgi:hypothetical protein
VWEKYSPEKHLPGYKHLGHSTRLDIRLDDNLQPKPGEEPINKTDEIAFHHDVNYLEADDDLGLEHRADRTMIEALKQVDPGTFGEENGHTDCRKGYITETETWNGYNRG